jgi:PIN domain nuclease of toxin-antitoxin system
MKGSKKRKRYLLDTHILIWLINENVAKFKNKKLDFLYADCFVSVESLKEIALKQALGKIDIESDPKRLLKKIENYNISILNFDKEAIIALFDLPFSKENTDPFDRSIVAHAISQKMILVSEDSQFRFYQKHGLFLQRL